jgi:RHS repeat-associated protein
MTPATNSATSTLYPAPTHFTGKERDTESGNDYFGARYYNPAAGRFLSRDPLDGNAVDPASLHKYLYASGDPVNAKDPAGKGAVLEDWDIGLRASVAAGAIYLADKFCEDKFEALGKGLKELANNGGTQEQAWSLLRSSLLQCVVGLEIAVASSAI